MSEDMTLVQKFAATKSDAVFSEIVSRHLNLVYSAAMRQVRDPHMAQEVTQAVFLILARKAESLDANTILSGWLHRTTRFVAINAVQAARRRQQRETEAHMETILNNQPAESIWREMMPLLDEALSRLRPADRDAVVLRYFENRSLREVASTLGLQESTAQKRVVRSLEKLRSFFLKRGVVISTAAIAVAVSTNSVQAAPAGLLGSVLAAAKGTATATSTMTLVKSSLKAMFWAKLKTPLAIGCSVVTVASGAHLTGTDAFVSSLLTPQETSTAWVVTGDGSSVRGLPHEFRGHAERILIDNPGPLDFIQVPVQNVNSGHLNFFIAADDNGSPGNILEQFSNVAAPAIGGLYPLTLQSVVHPKLLKNTAYWLCAEPADANSVAAWFFNANSVRKNYAVKEGQSAWTLMSGGAIDRNTLGHYHNGINPYQSYASIVVVQGGKN